MDHESAIRLHTPERYILGELPPPERDEFEEHVADCSVCMQELTAADIFAANAAAVFKEAFENASSRSAVNSKSWFEFLRPRAFPALAFSGALNLALLVFVGYGVTRISPLSETAPGISEVFAVQPPSRGAEGQIFTVAKSTPFVSVQFDLPHAFKSYSYSLEGVGHASVPQLPANRETAQLIIPVAHLTVGDHKLLMTGRDDRGVTELFHCIIRIQPGK